MVSFFTGSFNKAGSKNVAESNEFKNEKKNLKWPGTHCFLSLFLFFDHIFCVICWIMLYLGLCLLLKKLL